MKRVKNAGAQGDVLFIRRNALPDDVRMANDKVVAHSETGHHHVAVGDCKVFDTNDPLLSFLVAKGPVQIEHQRSWDTHQTLELLSDSEGEVIWEIRRQREQSPEGWRKVMD